MFMAHHTLTKKTYALLQGLTIVSSKVLANAAKHNWPVLKDGGATYLEAPGGYRFYIEDRDVTGGEMVHLFSGVAFRRC